MRRKEITILKNFKNDLVEQNKRCFKITTKRKRPRKSSKVSKRTTVTKRVNKKSYTNKYGTRVGPYNRKVSSFPNSYTTYRMINGEYRVCKITRKNGKEYMQVLDDKRRAKPITFAEAKKHFESLPENRQEADKRFRAKRTFTQTEITSSYLSKTGTSRYDVEDLDTPEKKQEIEGKRGGFYQEFYKFDEIEKKRGALEGRIKFLETDIKYTPKELRESKIKELEQCKKELDDMGALQWQEKPKTYSYEEIDPRYSKLTEQAKYRTIQLRQELNQLKNEFERKKDTMYIDDKIRLTTQIEEKSEELEKQKKVNKELFKEQKLIYWDDKLIEATIEEGKRLPTDVRRSMPEKYKKKYNQMMDKQKERDLKQQKERDKLDKERKVKEQAKQKAINEAEKKLPEMQEKFSKNARTKLDKEIWKEQPISDFGEDMKGILDPSRITLLTTNEQMKHSDFGEQFKDHKKIDFESNEMIMDSYGFQYEFDEKGECTYSQEYVDLAMKSMENPKVYYKKNTPLIIKDDTYTYIIAPRVEETLDDDIKETRDGIDLPIKLTPAKYKELMKAQKKAEMVEEYEKLQIKYEGKRDYDAKKKDKHEVLYDLLTLKREDVKGKETHTEKEVKELRKRQEREEIEKLHNKANEIMDKKRLIERDIRGIEKEFGNTRRDTQKFHNLKKKHAKLKEKHTLLSKEEDEVLSKKDQLLKENK